MKAFIIDRYKSKDVGRLGEVAVPELRENDATEHRPANQPMRQTAKRQQ